MRVRASLLITAVVALGTASGGQAASEAAEPAPGAGIQAALASAAVELAETALRETGSGDAAPAESSSAGTEAAGGVPRHIRAVARGAHAATPPDRRGARGLALSERPGGPAGLRVGSTTEFGSPRVLWVAARRGGWLGVVTTERPNNRLAWVRRGSPGLTLRRMDWSLQADLSDRALTLRKDGRRVQRMTVAIGGPGSETPTGRFAVTDKLSGSSYGTYYGCCVLALSGHQPNTPPGWTGGNRLAIHGTRLPVDDRRGRLGGLPARLRIPTCAR